MPLRTSWLSIGLVIALLPVVNAMADQLSFNFDTGLDESFTVLHPGTGWTIDTSPRIATSGFMPGEGGIRSIFTLHGDFSINVRRPHSSLSEPSVGAVWNGLVVSDVLTGNRLAVRQARYPSSPVISYLELYDETSGLVDRRNDFLGGADELRLTRSGSMLTATFFEASPGEAIFTASTVFSSNPVRIELLVNNNQLNRLVEAAFDDLEVTADQIIPEPSTLTLAASVSLTVGGSVGNRFTFHTS